MGGQVDGMFNQTNAALPQVKGGKVVAIAQTAKQRVPQFPSHGRRHPHGKTSSAPPGTVSVRPGVRAGFW